MIRRLASAIGWRRDADADAERLREIGDWIARRDHIDEDTPGRYATELRIRQRWIEVEVAMRLEAWEPVYYRPQGAAMGLCSRRCADRYNGPKWAQPRMLDVHEHQANPTESTT